MKWGRRFFTPVRTVIGAALLLIIMGLGAWLYVKGKDVVILNPQGVIAADEYNLINITLMLSAMVVIPVYSLLFFFAWKYSEGSHAKRKVAYTPDDPGHLWMEIIWWGIPIAIIATLAVIMFISTHKLDPFKPIKSDVKAMNVDVVALQWKWLFLYPDYHIATLNKLYIPEKTPVNFRITADGPMSTFWVPSLGTQVYAMPGMSMKLSLMADKAGVFKGYNTNINGKYYAEMTFDVNSMTRDSFDNWVDSVKTSNAASTLTWDKYTDLAKPSNTRNIMYYNLNNEHVYQQAIDKFSVSTSDYVKTGINTDNSNGKQQSNNTEGN